MHSILDLPEELLVEILRVCAVVDVLHLEQTCSTFRGLSCLRRVWLDQLRALEWYHAPNLPPNVSVPALSARELRSVVTKAVKSQRAWDSPSPPSPSSSSAQSQSPPGYTREDRVRLPMGRHFRRRMPLVTLCPGGAHLLVFWLDGVLELFDVQSNALVWAYPPEPVRASVKVEEFGFEMAPSGDLMVLVCMRSATLYLSASSTLFEIIRINPQKRTEQSVFQKVFHEDLEQFDFVESARISGNIAAVCMTNKICLIDWERDDCVELHSAYLVDSMEIAQQTLVCSQHAEDDYSIVVISFPHVFAAASPSLADIHVSRRYDPPSARRQNVKSAPAPRGNGFGNRNGSRNGSGSGSGAVSSVWRRLDYADAIAQFVLLKIPENNGVITQRMAVCTPTWRLAASSSSSSSSPSFPSSSSSDSSSSASFPSTSTDSASDDYEDDSDSQHTTSSSSTSTSSSASASELETTIYYIQYVEFVDGNKHNSLLHRFTLYGAGGCSSSPSPSSPSSPSLSSSPSPNTYPSSPAINPHARSSPHPSPRLQLESQLFGCIRLPRGLRPTTAANLSRAGRTVVAAASAAASAPSLGDARGARGAAGAGAGAGAGMGMGRRPVDFAHFKFSVMSAEERERQLGLESPGPAPDHANPNPEADFGGPDADADADSYCTPIELEGVEKGYTFEVEPYSGAVLYTLAREEMVVIRYYD